MREPAAAGTPRILIVEDEFLIAMGLVKLLEDAGYQVIGPVATVAGALVLLETERPDACVLDVNLRGEISAPVAKRLKDQKVPFLLSSAYGNDTRDQHAAFDAIISIGKPAPGAKLLSALKELLKS